MADIYQSFLRSPSTSHLASDAALHYITTTSTIRGADAIIKHLQAQSKQIQKKEEKLLSVTAGPNGVCVETETAMVFKTGGGLILPNMDENMLADMSAVAMMVHVVTLDQSGKISQIRLYWDQGTLLRQVEAIGKSGRNWPIRDGKEQVKLAKQSIETPGQAQGTTQPSHANGNGRMPDDYNSRLFATGVDEPRAKYESGIAPRETAKPQERQWGELFPNGEDGHQHEPIASSNIRSPHQPVYKSGAGQNYQPNRLFDPKDADDYRARSPERKQVDPTRNDHFEFGNGEDVPIHSNKNIGAKGQKQVSSWDFDDFVTPAKHIPRHNPEQERHIGYGIDEEHGPSPPKRPIVHAPRPDANTHFEITDENTPDHGKRPLNAVTNVNAARRYADHEPHFNIKSNAPANENTEPAAKNTSNVVKARSDMVSNWNLSQMTEPTPTANKKIYKTAGDGMGGRAGSRLWDIGGEDEPEQYGGRGGVKQVYKTYGNGMGGRKGTGLSWSIGNTDDE